MSVLISASTALFVPGNRADRVAKALDSGADLVIVDLEDAVAPADKAAARAGLGQIAGQRRVLVRINALGTPWHAEDLLAVKDLGCAGVMLPKAEPGALLADFAARIGAVAILALIETARGLAGAREVAQSGLVQRLAFGSIDFCADLDCAHLPEILRPARHELVLASKLAGLPAPFDGVTAETIDVDLVFAEAGQARALGMSGKLAIHPRQLAPIRRAFLPSAAELIWATQVMSLPEGVAVLNGAMVDAPVRSRAARILARAKNSEDQK